MNTTLNRQFHALINRMGIKNEEKSDMIYRYTDGRTASSRDLSDGEANHLIKYLKSIVQESERRGDKLRKTLIAMGYQIGWDVPHTKAWCEKHGVAGQKKSFNSYGERELMKLIKVMEMVLKNYNASTSHMMSEELINDANAIING